MLAFGFTPLSEASQRLVMKPSLKISAHSPGLCVCVCVCVCVCMSVYWEHRM